MKKNIFYITFLVIILFSNNIIGQKIYLKINNEINQNNKVYYFESAKLMENFVKDTIAGLEKHGYLNIKHHLILNDTIYNLTINKNEKLNLIRFKKIEQNNDYNKLLNLDSNIIKFENLDRSIKQILANLEKKGFSTTEIQLINHKINGDTLDVDLKLINPNIRIINKIHIIGYDKFPNGIKKQMERNIVGKILTTENLEKIKLDINNLTFVNQIKPIELLLKQDNSDLYIYFEKNKNNKFDGFIGFGSDDSGKLNFNGLIDLQFNNIINKGERTYLFWSSTGKKQTKFNLSSELPYIIKSPLGLKFNIENFKQDSTFQSTKTSIGLGYYFNHNTRLFINKSKNTSVNIQNLNNYKNYNSNFYSLNLIKEIKERFYPMLFQNQFNLNLNIGIGKRDKTHKQYILENNIHYSHYLNNKNSIYVNNITYYLLSNSYVVNEMYRIGGIQTLRGFSENSLQGNFINSTLIEYRYIINPQLYLHTISDFAIINDKINFIKTNTYSFGIGAGLLTKNGLFKLIYANGNSTSQSFNIKNSLFHISLNTTF